jgi:hypothetical protein
MNHGMRILSLTCSAAVLGAGIFLIARPTSSSGAQGVVRSIIDGRDHEIIYSISREGSHEKPREGSLETWAESTHGPDGRWRADGVRLRFDASGVLRCEDHFVLGARQGTCRTYDGDGRLVEEREFAKSLPAGLEKRYRRDGDLVLVRRYENGVEACAPLVRDDGDPPITDEAIACLTTEPIVRR